MNIADSQRQPLSGGLWHEKYERLAVLCILFVSPSDRV